MDDKIKKFVKEAVIKLIQNTTASEKINKLVNKAIYKINVSRYIPTFLLNFFAKKNNFFQQFVNIDNSKFREKKYILK